MTMQVLLAGPHWYGDITDSVGRALQQAGARVVLQYTNPPAGMRPGRLARLLPGDAARQRRALLAANHAALVAAAAAVDLVLVVAGENIAAETVAAMRQRGCPVAIWLIDDPFVQWLDPPRARQQLLATLPHYTHRFVFDDYYVDRLQSHFGGSNRSLPLAYDPELYTAQERPAAYPLVFVGTGYPQRRELLQGVADLGLGLWGEGWRGMEANVRGGTTTPQQTNDIYAQAQVIINHNHPQSVWSVNARTFEAPATGKLLLTDMRRDLSQLMIPDVEVVTYAAPAELREKAQYYLAHPDEAKRVAAAGAARVQREHTYSHRLRVLLQECGRG